MRSSIDCGLRISDCGPLFALLTAIGVQWGCTREPKPQRLPQVEIEVGGRRIAVEVARTGPERRFGMKFRKKLGADEGMLFVMPRVETLHFYMKDTYAPLSIAFLRGDGVILNIAHMQPLDVATHRSRLPCRLALEMPQGWFERNNVKEGDLIGLPEDLRSGP